MSKTIEVNVSASETSNKYDFKKSMSKAGLTAFFVILAGIASYYGQNPIYLAIAPVLALLTDWLKHKNDDLNKL